MSGFRPGLCARISGAGTEGFKVELPVRCLQGGCSFVCYPSAVVKAEAMFQRHSVKEVDFLKKGSTAVATVHVLNERPTVLRLGGTVFCEMPNGIVRSGYSFP